MRDGDRGLPLVSSTGIDLLDLDLGRLVLLDGALLSIEHQLSLVAQLATGEVAESGSGGVEQRRTAGSDMVIFGLPVLTIVGELLLAGVNVRVSSRVQCLIQLDAFVLLRWSSSTPQPCLYLLVVPVHPAHQAGGRAVDGRVVRVSLVPHHPSGLAVGAEVGLSTLVILMVGVVQRAHHLLLHVVSLLVQ